MSKDDEDYAGELTGADEKPEHEKSKMTANLAKKLALHNPWKRKLGITAVKGADGFPIHDEDKATAHLSKYWGSQFEEKPIDDRLGRAFVNTFANKIPEFELVLGFGVLLDMIRTSKKSAAGPDTIPCLTWSTSLRAQVFLFQALMFWLFCGTCPVFFNIAFLWLLPKGSPEDGVFEARDTRPLSGANSDAKIFAKFLAITFNKILVKWTFWMQRGFVPGRSMIKHVIDVETRAAKFAFNPNSYPCVIFFDYAAAFPSIARAFIWIVMEIIGVPPFIIRAIRALYANNIHFTRGSVGLSFAFCAAAGVRQGCPLSSFLFILATDCIIRALAEYLGPEEMIRAYADDIAIVARCFKDACLKLAPVFQCIQKCSCLSLNPKKCVAVPLWSLGDVSGDLREWLRLHVPEWENLVIASHGKYLGFFIGPGAVNKEWDKVAKKVLEASSYVRGLGKPKFFAFSIFHMFGYSQLQFVAQLRAPSKAMRRVELQTIRDLIGGPGLWAPSELFFHLKACKLFPIDLKAYDTLCQSALLKTALTIEGWQEAHQGLHFERRGDDDLFSFPFPQWLDTLAVVNLQKVAEGFKQSESAAPLRDRVNSNEMGCLDLQKRLYEYFLPKMHPLCFKRTLRNKFSKWFPAEALDEMTEHATKVLNKLSRLVPPCVMFALLSTWCNAWCTSARFQDRGGVCWLCSDCPGEDRIEHYGVCNAQWDILVRRLRVRQQPQSLLRFVCLDSSCFGEVELQACHVYAVKRAIDTRRGQAVRFGANALNHALWEGHKIVCTHSNTMLRRYRKQWT